MAVHYRAFDKNVIKMIGDKAAKALRRFGAYTRKVAKRSLKPARRKRQGELSEYEADQYDAAVRIARSKGQPKPKRPYKNSEPGELPRVRKIARYGGKSPLRNLIVYEYDAKSKSVVVGPAIFQSVARTKGVAALEHGGTVRSRGKAIKISARPFMSRSMQHALDKNILLEGFR